MAIVQQKSIESKEVNRRKNVKRIIKSLIILVFSFVLLYSDFEKVSASEVSPLEPMIFVEKYEITNERIVPGEPFTLSITLKNYSSVKDAKDVQVNVQNPEGVAPIYGTVTQLYVGDIKAGEEKTISFDYDSWTTIKSDTLDFYFTVYAEAFSNSLVLRVPSSADIPFSLLASNIPTEAYSGEYSSASLTFKVLGEENVSDVVLLVECNGVSIGASQAGSITAGTTKTQSVTFLINENGSYPIDIILEYVSSDGKKSNVLMESEVITVKEKKEENSIDHLQQNEIKQESSSNVMILGISGVLIIIIFLIVVMILRKKR